MYSHHLSYELLKSAISRKQMSKDCLGSCKDLFRNEIQSARRYACITNIADLLDILERRDLLSEYDIRPLHTIAEKFADDDIDMALEKYEPPPEPSELDYVYAMQRMQEGMKIKADVECAVPAVKQKPVVVIEYSEKKRDAIYQLIAREIGRDWRFLGRELLVRSGDLDNIDVKHPNDLHSKVYEVLKIFENDLRHNPREHYNVVCEALDKCKRKDIRRSIQKIMIN